MEDLENCVSLAILYNVRYKKKLVTKFLYFTRITITSEKTKGKKNTLFIFLICYFILFGEVEATKTYWLKWVIYN